MIPDSLSCLLSPGKHQPFPLLGALLKSYDHSLSETSVLGPSILHPLQFTNHQSLGKPVTPQAILWIFPCNGLSLSHLGQEPATHPTLSSLHAETLVSKHTLYLTTSFDYLNVENGYTQKNYLNFRAKTMGIKILKKLEMVSSCQTFLFSRTP